jgi:hypothetical protein
VIFALSIDRFELPVICRHSGSQRKAGRITIKNVEVLLLLDVIHPDREVVKKSIVVNGGLLSNIYASILYSERYQ